jgi:hypothetical protein
MNNNERLGTRNLDFSGWVRSACKPSSEGFTASDIDWVFRDTRENKIQIVEAKCKRAKLSLMQEIMYKELRKIFAAGIAATYGNSMTWYGVHVLQFENTSPANGRIWWDGVEITQEQLVAFLEMRDVRA